MRDLVRISDAELQELTSGQRLKMFGAICIAVACGVVSLQGMVGLPFLIRIRYFQVLDHALCKSAAAIPAQFECRLQQPARTEFENTDLHHPQNGQDR